MVRCGSFTRASTSPSLLSSFPSLPAPAAAPLRRHVTWSRIAPASSNAVRPRASHQFPTPPPTRSGRPCRSRILGDGTGLRYLDNHSGKATLRSMETRDDDNSFTETTSRSCTTHSCQQSKSPLSDLWKGIELTFLVGLLTFQVSQQAIAGTDFSGVQPTAYIGDLGDLSTGFASALLAARNSGLVVFLGTFGALAAMSVVSVVLGRTFHYIDGVVPFRFGETDFPIDDFAAVCLLVYFGVTTLLEAASDDGQQTTDEQKEAELAVSEFSGDGAGIMAAASTVLSTFVLVFVAEWGDKSFFSTIALAAASSPLGVIAGATAGHALATLLAVLGGSLLGTFVSEKVISYVGGVLFLVFAAVTLIEIVN
nr:PREDICTED: GDT1-like protein 1, chloroplastic isoform X3 [Musa acuminata subsp. malaccensis]